MPYDYSKRFLEVNAELAKKIIEAVTGDSVIQWSGEWEQVRKQHLLVNNLLANMAHNVPEWSDIRKKIRCWTDFGPGGEFRLFVGTPRHKMTGRPPGTGLGLGEKYVPAGMAQSHYHHDRLVADPPELERLVGKLTTVPEAVSTAEVRFEVGEGINRAWLEEFMSDLGWSVTDVTDDGRVSLRRV